MTRIAMAELHRAVAAALQAANTAVTNAESVATAIVSAEAVGETDHGLCLVPHYCALATSGKVDGYAMPSIAQSAPAALIVDAAYGFAYPALDLAIEELPAIAENQGVAMVGIRHSHHCGAQGCVAEQLADTGLIAIAMTNSPSAAAPGGRRKPVGANPVAFAVPLAGEAPLIVDLSGPGDGEQAARLALLVELLAAGMTGANFAFEASSFFEPHGPPPGVGQLLIAISPGAFGGAAVLDRFAELAGLVAGGGDAHGPGHVRRARRDAALRDGLAVDPDLMERIADIARQA